MVNNPEKLRRKWQAAINLRAAERPYLERRYGQVWDSAELARDFEVLEFAAPFAIVRRKADRKLGSVLFQHSPRYYFSFREHDETA